IEAGDSSEVIKLDIQSEAKGLASAVDEINRLEKALKKAEETLTKVAGNKGLETSWKNRIAVIKANLAALEALNKGLVDSYEAWLKNTVAAQKNASAINAQKKAWAQLTAQMQA